MDGKELIKQKEEIEQLGLNAIKDFFKIDLESVKPDIIRMIHAKAKIAIQFGRELSTDRRAIELNYIRVFRMIATDKKELKKYIKTSMPQYYPIRK